MASGRDDDALSWGDDDPTLDTGTDPEPEPDADAAAAASPSLERETPTVEPGSAEAVALPDGFTAVGRDSETVGRIRADGSVTMPSERQPMGNVALLGLGVLGGVYLLYVIGWVIGGLRLQGRANYLVTDVMFQGSFWLAVLAPIIWFGTVFLLTVNARPWVRFVWLAGGALLLLPWPFVMIGAVGQ